MTNKLIELNENQFRNTGQNIKRSFERQSFADETAFHDYYFNSIIIIKESTYDSIPLINGGATVIGVSVISLAIIGGIAFMVNEEDIDTSTVKYLIHEKFSINGVAERSDIIGALFGQTEGLVGEGLDLRELQKTSRIGRIAVKLQYQKRQRKTTGTLIIPSSLDRVETALLAAALETVDRVGPCVGKISLQKIEDVRESKRRQIIQRASRILKTWDQEVTPDSVSVMDEVLKEARVSIIQKFGKADIPAGPGVQDSDNLIIVEGRADVVNLLKHGFRNVIAVQGTDVPPEVVDLTRKKVTTAFLDGDHGGDLILRELIHLSDLDYVARAPKNREVEELSSKEILKALRTKIPIEQVMKELNITPDSDSFPVSEEIDMETELVAKDVSIVVKRKARPVSDTKIPSQFLKVVENLPEQQAALFDKDFSVLQENIPISDLRDKLLENEKVDTIIFDGIITQRLLDIAVDRGIQNIVGAHQHDITKVPLKLKIYTFSN
ncbi:MAG: DNA primase DnaG [Candidatus Hodarchaeales archaeon]|jgi:DNA primase